jgi:hypothetical protein
MDDRYISGWVSDFRPSEEQLRRNVESLRSVTGVIVDDAWVVWNRELDEWFADLPIVLQLADGRRLEICWEKFDDLSLTWGTIDVSVEPTAWVEWPLEWRPHPLAPLAGVTGASLTEVFATGIRFETHDIGYPERTRSSVWLTTGLWFGTGSGGLHVYNALDENGLAAELPPRDAANDRCPI